MTVSLLDAIDGARLVITDTEMHCLAVWHGGHTINFYTTGLDGHDVEPTTCINIGDFAEPPEAVTRREARDAIQETFEEQRPRRA